jgi:hypothetical protein
MMIELMGRSFAPVATVLSFFAVDRGPQSRTQTVKPSTIHIAIDSIVRTAGVLRHLSGCRARDAPTRRAVAR